MEEFRIELLKVFNEYNLPFEAKYYVLKDIYRDATDAYYGLLKQKKDAKEEKDGVQQCS